MTVFTKLFVITTLGDSKNTNYRTGGLTTLGWPLIDISLVIIHLLETCGLRLSINVGRVTLVRTSSKLRSLLLHVPNLRFARLRPSFARSSVREAACGGLHSLNNIILGDDMIIATIVLTQYCTIFPGDETADPFEGGVEGYYRIGFFQNLSDLFVFDV